MSTTSATPETIFMLRISLKNIKPEVWRRVLVPGNYTFKDLHDVVIAVMGWTDYHMHRFTMDHPVTNQEIEIGGVGDLGYGDYLWLPESTKIAHYLLNPNQKVVHEYDFGSPWYHIILFEKTIPAIIGGKYPQCIGGKRVPPPEDDPGSDYSDSEHQSKEFHHKNVNFNKCKQSVVDSFQKDKEVCKVAGKSVPLPTKTCSDQVSKNLKNKSTLETEPSAKKRRVIRIIQPSSSTATSTGRTANPSPVVREMPNNSSTALAGRTANSAPVRDMPNKSSTALVGRTADPSPVVLYMPNNSSTTTLAVGTADPSPVVVYVPNSSSTDTLAGRTANPNPIVLYVPNSSSTTASVGKTADPSPIVLDVPNSSHSEQKNAESQSQMESEKDADVDSYGKYIASQMLLVPDLKAREELRSVIQNTIEKYTSQKK